MMRAALLTVLLAAGCAPPAEQRRAEARAAEVQIAAGDYTDMNLDPAADPEGIMLRIPQGNDSQTVTITIFYQRYGRPAQSRDVAVRRGMNGIYFDAPYADGAAPTTFAVQPTQGGGVRVTWRDDAGTQIANLRPVERIAGLD